MLEKSRRFLEKYGFEVCERLADKIGIRPNLVRLSFIYLSFVTAGIVLPVYLAAAFFFKIKDKLFLKRKSVFDL
ncbi:MAG: PspC domain-containing protein [Flavobacteriales bacterium]